MPKRRGSKKLEDFNYEELANQVAQAVWSYNTSNVTISDGTSIRDSSQDFITINPNTFTIRPDTVPEQPIIDWRFNQVTGTEIPPQTYERIQALENKIQELERILVMVGKLLDEHIKRTMPTPTDRKKRSIILDEED